MLIIILIRISLINYIILIKLKRIKKNANTVACKLRLALTKAFNHKLEVVSEKMRKKEEIVENQKTKTITMKR